MRNPTVRPARAGRLLPLSAVALIALGMRPSVSAMAPVYPEFANAVGMDAGAYAILGALPPLAFAICGVLTARFTSQWQVETVLLFAVAATSVTSILRALSPNASWLFVSSALILLCIGILSILLPVFVKISFNDIIGRVTALYSALIAIGSSLPPLLVPAVIAPEQWRISLLLWGAITTFAVLPCLWLVRRGGSTRPLTPIMTPSTGPPTPTLRPVKPPRSTIPMHRSRIAWALASALTATTVLGYFFFAWLPTLLMDHVGVHPRTASLMLGIFAAIGFPAFAIGPLLTLRIRRPWILYVISGMAYLSGLLGILLFPQVHIIIWVIVLAMGQVLYSVAMTLLNTRTVTVRGAAALSGFMQAISYALGAVATWGLGALYLATHRWEPVLLILSGLVVIVSATGFLIGRGTIEEDLHIDEVLDKHG